MGLNQTLYNISRTAFQIAANPIQVIGSITQSSIQSNIDVIREVTSGNIHPSVASVQQIRPVASLTTLDVAAALDTFGTVGLCIAPEDELKLYLQKRICEGPSPADDHIEYEIVGGVLVPTTLSVANRQDATYAIDIMAVTDDPANAPVVKTTGVAIPSSSDENDRWIMGPGTTVAGVPLNGKQSADISFGVQVDQESSDGEVYDTFVGIRSAISKVTFSGLDPHWLDDAGTFLQGRECSHDDTQLILRKRDTADSVDEHIRITFAGKAYVSTPMDGTATSAATTTLEIDPIYDGVNAPIAVQTDYVIPPAP